MKRFEHLATALLVLVVTTAPALAMTCPPEPELNPDRIAEEVDIAFVGKLLAVTPSDYSPAPYCWKAKNFTARRGDCGGKIATFEIIKVLKGDLPKQARVLAEDGCYCLGAYFAQDGEYLIVGTKNPTTFPADILAKSVCYGTGMHPDNKRARDIINRLKK